MIGWQVSSVILFFCNYFFTFKAQPSSIKQKASPWVKNVSFSNSVSNAIRTILCWQTTPCRSNLHLGLLSISFRQTNVIWVAFMALQALGPNLMQVIYAKLHQNQQTIKFSLTTWGQTREVLEGTFYLMKDPRTLAHLCLTSLASIGGYLIVGGLFVSFVIANGGIAVGDKMAHAVTFHPTQVTPLCHTLKSRLVCNNSKLDLCNSWMSPKSTQK